MTSAHAHYNLHQDLLELASVFNLIVVFAFIIPTFLVANSYHCYASKSLIKYNSATGEYTSRLAKTAFFNVTNAEHEEAKTIHFIDKSKKRWGQVEVSTGAFKFNGRNYYHANANTVNKEGNITAYLTVKFSATLKDQVDATTIILDPLEDLSPNLSLTCFSKQ